MPALPWQWYNGGDVGRTRWWGSTLLSVVAAAPTKMGARLRGREWAESQNQAPQEGGAEGAEGEEGGDLELELDRFMAIII